MTLAAIFGQERQQAPRSLDVDGVENAPFDPPRSQQAGALQMREVVRQGRGRHGNACGNLPRRQPARPFANQQPEYRQAVLLGERCERFYGTLLFHISVVLEIWNELKWHIRYAPISHQQTQDAEESRVGSWDRATSVMCRSAPVRHARMRTGNDWQPRLLMAPNLDGRD